MFNVFFSEHLKPIAAHEREVEAQRAKEKAELDAIRKAEAAKSKDLFCPLYSPVVLLP